MALALMGVAAPHVAQARVRVFVGGAIGVPFPAYPYPYPYYYYPPAPYLGPYEAPPAAWVPGHWEWRYDPWGRRYRAWVPAHIQ